MTLSPPTLFVVMGVSGCGKSTVGQALAAHYDYPFLDADDFHSDANISKMTRGEPLTDLDRADWVKALNQGVLNLAPCNGVLACSALTHFVQESLEKLPHKLTYIHLDTRHVDMPTRLAKRDHFMPLALLDSQYAALTVPPSAMEFDANLPHPKLLQQITAALP